MRPFDWAPGVTALPIFLIVAMIFVRLVFYIFLYFFLFLFFQSYFAYFHTSYTWATGSNTQGNLIPRININIDTCIIRIARKRPDIDYLINEGPLRRLRNLIWLLFLYILFVLVEVKQSISFLTKKWQGIKFRW